MAVRVATPGSRAVINLEVVSKPIPGPIAVIKPVGLTLMTGSPDG